MIEELFPDGVVAMVASEAMWEGRLFPEEAACIERAVAKRRREFTAGRLCARAALARVGVPPAPLLPNSDRTPRWPEGIVGSISHCDGYCGVVVARRERFAGLGLDAEVAAPLDPALVPRICRPSELERLPGSAPPKVSVGVIPMPRLTLRTIRRKRSPRSKTLSARKCGHSSAAATAKACAKK